MKIRDLILKPVKYYTKGKVYFNDSYYLEAQKITLHESSKSLVRTDVINYLLSLKQKETYYLEVGVNIPENNFIKIKANKKYGVEPGEMFKSNPYIDFKLTSDNFFLKLANNEVLSSEIKFDVIFIDGLHLAEQVDRDITNAIKYIKDDGFIVLHDCNPPTEWHARECDTYYHTPANRTWNGTTWKAFLKWRCNPMVNSCCIDSDWGIGILSKKHQIGENLESVNPFFEFRNFADNRKEYLNLIDFETLKNILKKD